MTDDRTLAVRLNRGLLRSDLLLETASAYVASRPHKALTLARWASNGRGHLKRELASATEIDVSTLPYEPGMLEYLRREHESGRRVVLRTASDERLAKRISEHLGVFDDVVALDRAADHRAHSGEDWAEAPRTAGRTLPRPRTVAKAMRLHQWVKNSLVAVPFVLAGGWRTPTGILDVVLAFLVFGLVASSVYLLNDLVDVADDRHHHRKRTRPFASGELDLLTGWVLWPVLLLAGVGIAVAFLPPMFLVCLAGYYVTTVAYSFYLKRRAIFDIITLSVLYTVRIVAGAAAIGVPLSFWLLAFSLFMFLSLACVKRFSELRVARLKQSDDQKLRGRSYMPGDTEVVSSLGIAAGYCSVLVFALYINDERTAGLYATPQFLWLAGPLLLFWVSRTWMITHRGDMHDDPVVFALKDRVSWIVIALSGVAFALGKLVHL